MGIRFYCSGCGRKLNVKAFQAGRRGLCPYCGGSIEIPRKSTRRSSGRRRDAGADPPEHAVSEADTPPARPPDPQAPAAELWGNAAELASSQPGMPSRATPSAGATPMASGPTEIPAHSGRTERGQATGQTTGQRPGESLPQAFSPTPLEAASPATPAPPPLASPAVADPPAEPPDTVWYVRSADGAQYGPASGAVVQSWLAEGRVSPDSLVWREGWRDWQEAARAFPQSGAGRAEPDLGAVGGRRLSGAKPQRLTDWGSAPLSPSHPAGGRPAEGYRRQSRRRPTASSVAILTVLVLAVAVLFGVFLWVLFGFPP